MIVSFCDALSSLVPEASFAAFYNDDDSLNRVIWETETAQPTDAEVNAEVIRLQAAYDALEYSRLRKAKYDLLNQDEMRYDDVKNSTTTWVDAIDTIKTAHPKP
jgi:pullulanase/glycogen debranching enzyme